MKNVYKNRVIKAATKHRNKSLISNAMHMHIPNALGAFTQQNELRIEVYIALDIRDLFR